MKLTLENRHASLISYAIFAQELMSIPCLTNRSWISNGVDLSYLVIRKQR